MRIEGYETKVQCVTTGKGMDIIVNNELWAFYPEDLIGNGNVGYLVSPHCVSYHVNRVLYLDGILHMFVRKIRKDRRM